MDGNVIIGDFGSIEGGRDSDGFVGEGLRGKSMYSGDVVADRDQLFSLSKVFGEKVQQVFSPDRYLDGLWGDVFRKRFLDLVDAGWTNFDGVKFLHVDFGEVDFSGLSFNRASFVNVDFKGCGFKKVGFRGASFRKVNFSAVDGSFGGVFRDNLFDLDSLGVGQVLIDVDFSGASFEGVDFQGRVFKNVVGLPKWVDAGLNANNAYSSGTLLNNVFGGFDELKGAYLKKLGLYGVNLGGCDLQNLRFEECEVVESGFLEANMSGCVFRDVRLTDVDFMGANLSNSFFSNVDFRNVNFSDAVLDGAAFVFCKFGGVEFSGGVLKDISLDWSTFDVSTLIGFDGVDISLMPDSLRLGQDGLDVFSSVRFFEFLRSNKGVVVRSLSFSDVVIDEELLAGNSFVGVNFINCDFSFVDVNDVEFRACIFKDCHFVGGRFVGSVFEDCNFSGDFGGVDFRGVRMGDNFIIDGEKKFSLSDVVFITGLEVV